MSRGKRAILNTIAAFSNEIVSIIAGFIVPRLILIAFGSDVNGLVTSIAQFLGFISFLEAGVGAVIKSNLYKPLSLGDDYNLSCVISSSQKFFRTIAIILICYTFILIGVFPRFLNAEFDYIYTSTLILIISVSLFFQYYFGITNQLLLIADQRAYIPLFYTIVATILNTIACVVVIKIGGHIHLVKVATAIFFTIKPILLYLYVKTHYNINHKVKYHQEPIKQKWNGLAQHIAMLGQDNVPAIIITIFSTLSNVSIYAVYILVINGIKQLVNSVNSSIGPIIGELIAKDDDETLSKTFSLIEWGMHNVIIVLYTVTGILIVPFILLYTEGVADTNYEVPFFAICLTIAGGLRSIQLCYNMVIQAAGKFKETQNASFIELFLNVVISSILVTRYGLIGVAIGMIVSLLYRLFYLVFYLRYAILNRSYKIFLRQIIVDLICVAVIILFGIGLRNKILSYPIFIFRGIVLLIIASIITLCINYCFYRENINYLMEFRKNRINKKENVEK